MAIIDLVRWAPEGENTLFAYKFPESNLSTFTQLIVQESQEAVLFSKGKVLAKFGPGKHTLSTENIPLLRSFFGIPFGGKNPFIAEIWFVNLVQTFSIDWAIDRMDIHDVDYNTGIPLISSGKYGLKVKEAEKFLLKIVGTKSTFSQDDLTEQFFGEFSTKSKSTIVQYMLQNGIGLKSVSAHLDNISTHLKSILLPFWEDLGLDLTKFYVTTIEVDSTTSVGQRVLDAISRQSSQAIGGYTWQQSQAFEVTKDAVGSMGGNSGLLGALVATNLLGGIGGGNAGMIQPQYDQPSFNSNARNNIGTPPNQTAKDIYCSNCSKKFSSNQQFCPHCGDEYIPCPSCKSDNDKKAKKCVTCGQQLLSIGASTFTVCLKCSTPMEPGALFCGNCGQQAVERKCSRCSAVLSDSTKFCTKCGQKN
jgi:membrane protease subunit (stomatin/prohibitin family)